MDYKQKLKDTLTQRNILDQILIVENENDYEIEVKDSVPDLEILLLVRVIRRVDSISKIHIRKQLLFDKQTFGNIITLENCILYEDISFRQCHFKEVADFRHIHFKSPVDFYHSKFEQKVRFHHSHFYEKAKFENTKFHDLVDFYEATFHKTHQFFLTDFLNVSIFSHTKFHKQIQFLYCKTSKDSVISFENATFSNALDISRANFCCKIIFWKIDLTVIPKEIYLYENDNRKFENVKKPVNALKRLRETYRIIKDNFSKEGNHIEALIYYKNEMLLFQKEQRQLKKSSLNEDTISLFFNRFSSNFGTSWWQGIKFTFFITLLFYVLFLSTFYEEIKFMWTWNAFGKTAKHFVEFLNITKWDIKPFGITSYSWGYIILFIGRIFIGYGYYQTIQAFRKFGKS